MDGGPCIRMENADDPRFALNAVNYTSGTPVLSEENLKIVSIVGFGGIGNSATGAHPGGLVLQEATPIEGDGDSLKLNADDVGTLAKSQHGLVLLQRGSSDELSDGSAHPGTLLLQKATYAPKDRFKASRDSEFTYQAGMNPPGGFWCSTESEHSSALHLVIDNNLFLEIALAAYLGGYSTIGEFLKEKIRRRIDGNDCLVFFNGESSNRSESRAGIWIMDSGAQCHATGDLRLFSGHLNMTKQGSWIYGVSGHEHPLPIRGLEQVYYVEGLGRNLICLSKFQETFGYTIRFGKATYIEEEATGQLICELRKVRTMLLLLAILVATLTYQAGMNPPVGFWSGTESEHSRIREKGELKDVVRSQTLLSCRLAIALLFTLLNLFKATGIPPKAKETGASKDYESTSMGSYTEYDPENSSGSDSMVAKDNAVAETVATWQVGSASTHHATGNRALLSDFITVDDLNIQTGDGIIMPVSGRGSVITDTVVLHDVWFVPGLKKNVVSVSQLAELDCSIVFKRDACYISGATDGTIIGKALVGENGMFKLEFLKVPLVN